MRVIVIGGTGHIGTYLVPRLVQDGHKVVVVGRGQREPYRPHAAWQQVQRVAIDREKTELDGEFGERIRALDPEVVIDLICFQLVRAHQLVAALDGHVQHFLHCGTIWTHGPTVEAPTGEEGSPEPFGDYGIQKLAIERFLLEQARKTGFPATCVHPGHIVGPGWAPLNPQGNFNLTVWEKLASGDELTLPNFGMETVHHVHADDVAQVFVLAIRNWSVSVGQSFHAVSPAALSLRGYATAAAGWFGREARLRFLPWEEWRATVGEEDADATYDHIAHSPNCSIARAERLLGYQPRYTSLEAVKESLDWLVEKGQVESRE